MTASGFSSSPGLACLLHVAVSGPTRARTPHPHSLWSQSKSQGQIQGDGSPRAGERPSHQANRPEGECRGGGETAGTSAFRARVCIRVPGLQPPVFTWWEEEEPRALGSDQPALQPCLSGPGLRHTPTTLHPQRPHHTPTLSRPSAGAGWVLAGRGPPARDRTRVPLPWAVLTPSWLLGCDPGGLL